MRTTHNIELFILLIRQLELELNRRRAQPLTCADKPSTTTAQRPVSENCCDVSSIAAKKMNHEAASDAYVQTGETLHACYERDQRHHLLLTDSREFNTS